MAVYYALIARGPHVIADHSETEGQFVHKAKIIITKIQPSGIFKTYTDGLMNFSFYSQNDLTFMCYGDTSKDIALQFLQSMQKQFPQYRNKAAAFAEVIKDLLNQYSVERVHQVDTFLAVETNLTSAIQTTKKSIEEVSQRGNSLTSMKGRTEKLSSDIGRFKFKSKQHNQWSWKFKIKMLVAVFLLVVVVLYLVADWLKQNA